MNDEIDDDEFLSTINYDNDWGFPWQNFKMILEYAKSNRFHVIGINTDNAGRDSLAFRDDFAAKVLIDTTDLFSDHKVFCLIGEYHLAEQHLLQAIAKEQGDHRDSRKILRVLCNTDKYYFATQTKDEAKSSEYLKLKSDYYCLINSPPWMKWHSFSLWEEMRSLGTLDFAENNEELQMESSLFTEDHFDFDYQFLEFVKRLTSFLDLKIEESELENFYIHYSKEGSFVGEIEAAYDHDEMAIKQIVERVMTDGVFFLEPANKVLLTHLSVNNFAEAAGQFLQKTSSGVCDSLEADIESFYRRVLKAAAGMVASKILNPRRKCASIQTAKQFVRRHKGRKLTGNAYRKRECARALVKHHDWMNQRLSSDDGRFIHSHSSIYRIDYEANFEVSRDLGQMLGYNLYSKVLSNRLPTSELQKIFTNRHDHWELVWEQVFRLYSFL